MSHLDVNHHLLQIEASIMRVERYINLWVEWHVSPRTYDLSNHRFLAQNDAKFEFHHVEWAFNQTRKWLVTPITFMAQLKPKHFTGLYSHIAVKKIQKCKY